MVYSAIVLFAVEAEVDRTIAVYVSGSVNLMLLIGVLCYHVFIGLGCLNAWRRLINCRERRHLVDEQATDALLAHPPDANLLVEPT